MTHDELPDFGQRLKAVRERLGQKQKDFAAHIGITPPFLSEIEKGKSKPGFEVLRTIAGTYHINLNYLLFGEGEPFRTPSDDPAQETRTDTVDDKKFKELLYYLSHAPTVKYAVYEFLSNYVFRNRDMIDAEIKKYGESKGD